MIFQMTGGKSFNEICNRDQVLLPYFLKKHGIKYDYILNSQTHHLRYHPDILSFLS